MQARSAPTRPRSRVDWRVGDLADLAFLRADSIDAVLSVHALSEVDDSARVFRQVERVLRPNAPFVFSYEHPFALCVDADGTLRHPPSDRGPIEVDGRLALRAQPLRGVHRPAPGRAPHRQPAGARGAHAQGAVDRGVAGPPRRRLTPARVRSDDYRVPEMPRSRAQASSSA